MGVATRRAGGLGLALGFMLALAAGGGLGTAGVPILLVEPGILGSLVAIGLAVALAWRVGAARRAGWTVRC